MKITLNGGIQLTKTEREYILSSKSISKLKKVTTATLTSQLLKRGFRNTFIQNLKPSRPDLNMVGYAFTLRYVPIREDLGMQVDYDNETDIQRQAVESVREDDVLVIDAREELGAASFGHIIATRISKRKATGLVTDGGLRDTPRFPELDFPVYYKGAHATTSSVLHHPVDMNVPIGCGGVLVMPGDIIVGDAEGVVVIPAAIAEEVAIDAYEQDLMEDFIHKKVERGSSIKGVYPPDSKTLKEYREWKQSIEL